MLSLSAIQEILQDRSSAAVEALARRAKAVTEQHFGRTIGLYAPLYLSNYCSSHCTYCGFHVRNKITRIKLTPAQIDHELRHVAQSGIQNILLLTGESYKMTPTSYLIEAADIASKYFQGISLEVHPMDTDEYAALFAHGVDGITVYQETYNRDVYAKVHIAGKKKDYDYRYGTPERAAKGGMRQMSLGILLGLAPLAEDLFALYSHLRYLEKAYPGVEYSLSFPRLRTIKDVEFAHCDIDDITFVQVIAMTRLLFPRVGINLSTREAPRLRDHLLEIGITRMSAGSNTSVGGYSLVEKDKQDPQFDIEDTRTVEDVIRMLKSRNFDPVLTDWRRIENASQP